MPDTVDLLRASFDQRPFTAQQAERAGVTRPALKYALARGRIVRLGRAVFILAAQDTEPRADQDYLARVRAAALLHPNAVAVGQAAAALHGLWCPWPSGWRDIQLCSATSHRSYSTAKLVRRSLVDADTTTIDGIRCTTPARTALDIAATATLPEALVLVDSVARLTQPTRHQARDAGFRTEIRSTLLRTTARMRQQRGIERARCAAALANPASESASESYARGLFIATGHSEPEVGRPVRGADGTTYYADPCWPTQRLIVEVDGAVKYEQRHDVIGEKRREDAIRRAGWRVVRVWASELWSRPQQVLQQLEERWAA